jgi:hypothetical protein
VIIGGGGPSGGASNISGTGPRAPFTGSGIQPGGGMSPFVPLGAALTFGGLLMAGAVLISRRRT